MTFQYSNSNNNSNRNSKSERGSNNESKSGSNSESKSASKSGSNSESKSGSAASWRSRLRRGGLLALAGGLLAVAAAGCNGNDAAPSGVGDNGSAATVAQPAGGGEPNRPAAAQQAAAYRFPLTGAVSGEPVHDRPVTVMVENAPQARPQSGLDQADLVYEILAEGEITRFVAVYQAQAPKVIGPVRSIRPYFVKLGEALDAVIVHAGWSQDAMDLIAAHKLEHLDEVYGDGAYYWRASDRKMPHNLYTSIEKIRQGAEKKKFRTEWNLQEARFAFAADQPPLTDGKPVTKATVNYIRGYNVTYQYNPNSGLYDRFMAGKPHVDKETGKQLTAANILVCESKHQVLDSEGRRDVDVDGPGKGYLLQGGRMKEVTWEQKNGMIRAFSDGRELAMVPGQTWIQIVPEGWGIDAQ
ncbi:DUF3048 domain-containing protein [Paenibacillus sp. H1-7]|uniref:DUF3048 domain-containing protein n=1 Tax=Paenibacillus sp. H1-7 TaxID=2282849 RepID=UPI001EF88AD7|nr:DUF3048 domain-containing protein [Paenibacillus sp. H1-7]ULL13710.1 DUF3048 domain-containing protein [Paenibacillus sp. H1-7]